MEEIYVGTKDGECYNGILIDIDTDCIEIRIFNHEGDKVIWIAIIPLSAITSVNVKPETLGVTQL